MSRPPASLGVLIPGPGALKTQFNYPPLTPQQYELVLKAKKYSAEETARIIHSNKPLNINALPHSQPPDRTLQRHQAIQFMSRVYVGNISFEVREEMLKVAFSNYGFVKSVNMSWINATTHKGFAFIEFDHPEGAGLAIERINGVKLGGRQIKVGRPSNMPQDSSILEEIDNESENGNTIYIANIRPEFDENDLLCLMDPFGEIVKSKFLHDELQRKSLAYIQFKEKADAIEALTADKLDLAGYTLNICKALAPLEPVTNNDNHVSASTSEPRNEEKIANKTRRAVDNQCRDGSNDNDYMDNINSDFKNIDDDRGNSGTDDQAQSSLSSEVVMDIESTIPDHQKPQSNLPSAYANTVADQNT